MPLRSSRAPMRRYPNRRRISAILFISRRIFGLSGRPSRHTLPSACRTSPGSAHAFGTPQPSASSCSLIIPMICASVKRLFLMSSAPSQVGQTLHQTEGAFGSGSGAIRQFPPSAPRLLSPVWLLDKSASHPASLIIPLPMDPGCASRRSRFDDTRRAGEPRQAMMLIFVTVCRCACDATNDICG